jgi:hypothetical protein
VTLRYILNVLIKRDSQVLGGDPVVYRVGIRILDMYSNEEEAISSKRLPGKEDVML